MDIDAMLSREIQTINRTFVHFGVQAATAPARTLVAGSSFVAYGLRTGATQRISEIARLLPELGERLSASRRQATPVRLREMPLALEVAHPQPAPLHWSKALLRVGGGRMVAGRNYSATPVADCVLDLAQRPHVLVAGTTNSGKSTMLRMMLASLAYSSDPASLRMVVVDRKHEDMVPFARLPHVEMAAYTAEDAQRAIATVHGELQRRVDAGLAEWPRLVLVIDELAQLDAGSLEQLSAVLAVGRSKRINVLAATQHPAVRLIGDKANYSVRMVGQVMDAQTAALATGRKQSGAELLPGAGAFLYVDGATLDRIQAYNLDAAATPALVAAIAQKWGAAAPVQLPVVEPMRVAVEPVEDEISRIAKLIEPLWRQGASKSAMCREALSKPYAGSYATKVDRALALLERRGSTTTTQHRQFAVVWQSEGEVEGSSSRELAPVLRMGGAR